MALSLQGVHLLLGAFVAQLPGAGEGLHRLFAASQLRQRFPEEEAEVGVARVHVHQFLIGGQGLGVVPAPSKEFPCSRTSVMREGSASTTFRRSAR